MKNWLKKKLRNWLFKDEKPNLPNLVEHRVINVPGEIITLQSRNQISSRELHEMIVSGRLTKDAAMQLIYNEAVENLVEEIKKGGFIQTTVHTQHSFSELGMNEVMDLKLLVCKPKY